MNHSNVKKCHKLSCDNYDCDNCKYRSNKKSNKLCTNCTKCARCGEIIGSKAVDRCDCCNILCSECTFTCFCKIEHLRCPCEDGEGGSYRM